MKMKVVTKRHGPENPIEDARILQKTLNKLRGYDLVPKGVYRFKTFEDADEWMMDAIVKTHVHRKSKTL